MANLGGRRTARAEQAVEAYLAAAKKHGVDPVHMALAWCAGRPFMGSVIFGATSIAQLDRALGAADVTLSAELLEELDDINRAHPLPY